jgi:hypothetical protein
MATKVSSKNNPNIKTGMYVRFINYPFSLRLVDIQVATGHIVPVPFSANSYG